jgi:hypothetical protein
MLVSPEAYPQKATEDGSYTFFSTEFGECYHSTSGAREEAEKNLSSPVVWQQKQTRAII